jgi:hypothetical protein
MTFKEIQDAVLTDRFAELKRAEVKNWINSRYGRLWAMEPWSFKLGIVESPVLSGVTSLSMSALGFQRLHAIYGDYGSGLGYRRLDSDRPEDFHLWALARNGRTVSFTVIGDAIMLDQGSSAGQTLTLLGERKWAPLVDDTDVPLIPAEFHWGLVHGATSEGLRIENDPTWQGAEQDWQANINDLRLSYLTNVMGYSDSSPAWPSYV